ncbi:SEC12-like protein 1 [Linum perenne]
MFQFFTNFQATYELEETDGDLVSIAVHPSGDHFVCSTTDGGCKSFELEGEETNFKIRAKDLSALQSVGPQKCLAFSVDGSKLASGGVDGHLRILNWPSLGCILDEPIAHKSFQDMDFSLDSEFLASTSIDGSARIWKTEDGSPVVSLARSADERIELCRFSKDGTKPFLFCAVQLGDKAVISVYDISAWKKIGFKRLLRKPASMMSVSVDGKYLALGSKDGDICVADVRKMEVNHWSRKLHLGTSLTSLEFCPSHRVVLTTSNSNQCCAKVTKLTVPADWKEWEIYVLLVGLFLASAVAFYIFFKKSDSLWNFPMGRDQPGRARFEPILQETPEDPFGPLDFL